MLFKSNLKTYLLTMLCVLALAIPQLVIAQTVKSSVVIDGRVARIDSISLYPNPIINILNITTGGSEESAVKIDVYALDGRLVHTSQHKAEYGRVSVDLSKLNRGLYILTLTIGKKRTAHKILKD